MMQKLTLRGYVWAFCMYLALVIDQIAHYDTVIRPPHFDHSVVFTLVPNVIVPTFVIFIFLSALSAFRNKIMRAVLIFSAITFACSIVFALHQFEYISFSTPHWISGWTWFIATILLGYRTDQLLKVNNREIETN